MKQLKYFVLACFAIVLASCGGKSNSGEAAAEEATSEDSATPKCEPADPPFTYGDGEFKAHRYSDGSKSDNDYENVPLDGCFEIQKVSVVKTTHESSSSSYSYKVIATVNLKMIKDYPNKVDYISGNIQLLNKDGAVIADLGDKIITKELKALKVGGIGVISSYKLAEYDADGLVNDTKYIRITEFRAGHIIE